MREPSNDHHLRVGSLFSGYGGLDLAVEEVFGARTVWFSEINEPIAGVFARHWPDAPNLGDITTIDWTTAPPVDILCGGFPCQDVSTVGKRAGLAPGTRSGLWANMVSGIESLQPEYVVIENVRGLLSAPARRATEEGDADEQPNSASATPTAHHRTARALARNLERPDRATTCARLRGMAHGVAGGLGHRCPASAHPGAAVGGTWQRSGACACLARLTASRCRSRLRVRHTHRTHPGADARYIARRTPWQQHPRSVRCVIRPLTTRQLTVDLIVAALFAAVVAWPEFLAGRAVQHNLLGTMLVVVLMAAAVALRRLSPGIGLVVAWFGAIVQMAFGRPPSLTDVAIFAVLYTTAAYGSRLVFWFGFGSAIAGAGVITAYLFAEPILAGEERSTITAAAASLVAAMLALLLAWTVGALVRTALRAQENRVAQQRAEAEAAAEQERVRIARDMHDVVAHSLAVVVAQADGARYAAASDPSVATEALGTISTTARGALSDVRMLLTQLRHSESDGPQPTLADLEQLYAQLRTAGVDLRVDVAPASHMTPPASIQFAVYRILQEALTNALQHGGAGPVDVRLAWHAERVDLEVRNALRRSTTTAQVQPTTHGASDRPRGHGIIGMRERAQLVGGRLDALAQDGAFVVRATLPIGGMS